MSNLDIQRLLARLRDQIRNTELDPETRALVEDLDSDLHDLLDADKVGTESATVLKRAEEFEANFESQHPTTVRVLREVAEAIARMGI